MRMIGSFYLQIYNLVKGDAHMLYPTLTEVQELLKEYDVVPVFYEVLSDSMTPIHIFNALKEKSDTCFILESVDNTQWGRYSLSAFVQRWRSVSKTDWQPL